MPKHPKPLKALLPYKEVLGPIYWNILHNRVNAERANKPYMSWREYLIIYRE